MAVHFNPAGNNNAAGNDNEVGQEGAAGLPNWQPLDLRGVGPIDVAALRANLAFLMQAGQ